MTSNPSIKSTHGAARRALSTKPRTDASTSPDHRVRSSGPLIQIKLIWHSLATAFANNVLPMM